jgi:hypothetical protein
LHVSVRDFIELVRQDIPALSRSWPPASGMLRIIPQRARVAASHLCREIFDRRLPANQPGAPRSPAAWPSTRYLSRGITRHRAS